MNMERTISQKLDAWRTAEGRKPLVLLGARQTGKTTSLLQLGEERFERVVHADFVRNPRLARAFAGSLEPSRVLRNLEAMLDQDITPGRTLLILDEIQECDAALTALKYFCTELPELHVAAAGSLPGVHVDRDHASFPVGYVDLMTMHPMDFGEFCAAAGHARMLNVVRDCLQDLSPCPIHDDVLGLYRSYLLVGGMPEAVRTFCGGASLDRVREVQANIQTAYLADMTKYANGPDSAKILASWGSIPTQLARESGSTKFAWREIASGARSDRYATALDWLVAAGLVSRCARVTDGVAPLASFEDRAAFKAYVADTGLLSQAYDARPEDFDDAGHRSARFRGGIAENYVMQQLVATGLTPHYWGVASQREVDFVVRLGEGVVPIEVKSGQNVTVKSLRFFMREYGCERAIVLSTNDFSESHGITYVPLYAAHLIGR